MKAFEEKFPNLSESQRNITCDSELSEFYKKRISQKEGWKAALKWLCNARNQHIKDGVDVLIEEELDENARL